MSVIKVNTIQNANGTTALTIAANGQLSRVNTAIISDGTYSTSANNVIQGSAKAWVNFNGVSGTTIRSAYNISSVTRVSTGIYTINFPASLFSDTNWNIIAMSGGNTDGYLIYDYTSTVARTSSSTTLVAFALNGSPGDSAYVNVAVFR